VEVTLFATRNSETTAKLVGVCLHGYKEDPTISPEVWEWLHIAKLFEHGDEFDLSTTTWGVFP